MYRIKVCNLKGEGRRIESLSSEHSQIFCEEAGDTNTVRLINFPLIDRVIDFQRKKARQVLSSTKTRNEINCSKRKIFRQKGRGASRHGSKNAPQFRGGAKAWGPREERVFEYDLNKKVRKLALCSALVYHAERGTLYLIDDKDFMDNKTKNVISFLNGFPIYPATKTCATLNLEASIESNQQKDDQDFIPQSSKEPTSRVVPKALFVGTSKEDQKNTLMGVKNLNSNGVNFIPAIGLNVLDVMKSTYLFVFKDSLDQIKNKCVIQRS